MKQIMLNYLSRLIVVTLASTAMITNSFVGVLHAQEDVVFNTYALEEISSKTLVSKDALLYYKKGSEKKAKSLEAYFAKNPTYKNVQIPKPTIENGKLAFVVEGKKFTFSVDDKGVLIEGDSKSISLPHSMSLEEKEKKIISSFGEKKFSFFNLIIPEANAEAGAVLLGSIAGGIVLAIVAVVVVALYVGYKTVKHFAFESAFEGIVKECEKYKELPKDQINIEEMQTALHKMTQGYLTYCTKWSLYNSAYCDKIPSVQSCFQEVIAKATKNLGVNESARSAEKEKAATPAAKAKSAVGLGK
jgi:hypothetical protein